MTAKDLFAFCVKELKQNDDAEFDVTCIFEDLLKIGKNAILFSDDNITDEQYNIALESVKRRKSGEPLQYILGKWDFYDMAFYVGEGVLIPRPETELLVDFALEKLKNIKNPVIFDLCAGSGCIGLTLANHRKDANVFLLEKENGALKFLRLNKEKYKLDNANIIQSDLFNFDYSKLPKADIILSNPPYIPANEINGLQKEVHFEPVTALNGGKDGLDFYRCIAEKWVQLVKIGGCIALECGDGQSNDIIDIFKEKCTSKEIIYDFNNIDRIVAFGI